MSKDESKRDEKSLEYQQGFGTHFSSEVLPGALPKVGNNPQKCKYGLYCEQLSGTSFTTPRVKNQRSWLYRITPSCKHKPFKSMDSGLIRGDFTKAKTSPNQIRWDPLPLHPDGGEKKDFVSGMVTWLGAGSAESKSGLAVHLYSANVSMVNKAFYSADGDFLIVPQEGDLRVQTEFGLMDVKSGEICVIQRGIKFSVGVSKPSRGYILEVFQGHFTLPDLGPIGANGLANPRDFESPVAFYEHKKTTHTLVQKFLGELYETSLSSSPFDVVAWHGNYVPYKYDLDKFCPVNAVKYDHMDPSIFTVLTCPSHEAGVAVADFVIFPPRWMVQEETFRPPYYHRNFMSEYMGNIRGMYEAKRKGFVPGGGSLHNTMIGHGPDAETFEKTSTCELKPMKSPESSMSFMFESCFTYRITKYAAENHVQEDYHECWDEIADNFDTRL